MIRPIAIYLPQFHPVSENDEWWGKGFTEWTNVAKARPLFEGHYQPHLPADLGFYDLRLKEARAAQAEMAKAYGIYGFCYYHYWFNGRRILERPFQEVFESGQPDFPFMLCWANENWTRVWDGGDKHVLLEQNYSEEDDRAHIQSLLPYFKDDRYIKVNGKPIFSIYRSKLFPNLKRTTNIWREEAGKQGMELYLCCFATNHIEEGYLESVGLDAAVDFKPFGDSLTHYRQLQQEAYKKGYMGRAKNKLAKAFYRLAKPEKLETVEDYLWNIIDYTEYAAFCAKEATASYKCYPGITPMWDNTARRKKNFLALKNATPTAYRKWLSSILQHFKGFGKDEDFLFINAWNEWAEGNHLEPCQKWGRQYLEATKEALQEAEQGYKGPVA